MPKASLILAAALAIALSAALPARAVLPFHFGLFPSGPLDGITDVPGVMVANLTKIEGSSIRTGATAVLPNADPWTKKVSAGFLSFNGNGEMTGTHWIEESGYLEEPIVLTDTLDVGRAADGVVSWMIEHHPLIGRDDDVPLPVVAECDDGSAQRHSSARGHGERRRQAARLGRARPVRARIGRRGNRDEGVRIQGGDRLGVARAAGDARRVPRRRAGQRQHGQLARAAHRSTACTSARNSRTSTRPSIRSRSHCTAGWRRAASSSSSQPTRRWTAVNCARWRCAPRSAWGAGLTSDVGSGDLFVAFSTSRVFQQTANFTVAPPSQPILEDDDAINALYRQPSKRPRRPSTTRSSNRRRCPASRRYRVRITGRSRHANAQILRRDLSLT